MAPIIVLGSVLENVQVGEPVASIWTPSVFLQEHKVTCRLEELLRWDSRVPIKDEFVFEYFALAEERQYNPYYKQFYRATPGTRYLFPLVRQGDTLRSIGDGGVYAIPVYSGRHDPQSTSTNAGMSSTAEGLRISDILLTPGSGLDTREFSLILFRYRMIAEVLGSRLHTFDLLKKLIQVPEGVGTSACFELNHSFETERNCLKMIAEDQKQPEDTRRKAAQRYQETAGLERTLLQQLRDPAQLGFSPLMNPDSLRQNQEELMILLRHSNADIRHDACTALKRYFPYSADAKLCAVR